ncbi:MAG TPA: hypothetical protein VJ571_02475 [Candidatus Nitrosotalea sp.]|nr:hypothetical protein [Candidatus Nitrosotalea sp.]
MPDYVGLGTYAVVGAVLRYLMICPSGSPFAFIVNPYVITFIVIGIGFGLFSFIYRNKKLSGNWKHLFDAGRGIITGFSIGWGGVTVWILAVHPCS